MFSNISALSRFPILLCCSDEAQASRMVAYLIEQGVPLIKWTTLSEEKKVLGQKTSKNFFFGFSHITALKLFAILLQCFDDAQTSWMVVYLIEQAVPLIKWTTLSEEKKFWAKKLQKNGFFGFSHITALNLLAILL